MRKFYEFDKKSSTTNERAINPKVKHCESQLKYISYINTM